MRTAIVAAMQEELAAVLALMPHDGKQVAAGRQFWVGELHGREVVVVADRFLQHDLDASPIFPRFEVPLYGTSTFGCDVALTKRVAAAAASALPGVHLHRGLVVSGDRFVATTAESRALQAALPAALAVEMEGAAFAQVCHDCGVPFAAVRTVSDRADDMAHIDFATFIRDVASRHSAAIVRALLA